MISRTLSGARLRRLVFAGILIALGTLLSPILRIPGMCPMQHFINIVGAVLLGPAYAFANALLISFFRMTLMGVNVLALTGSMFGALLSGLLYRKTRSLFSAFLGEVIGTGIFGALLSYPALLLLTNLTPPSFYYYIPWFVAGTLIGGSVALVFLGALLRTGQLTKMQKSLGTSPPKKKIPCVLTIAGSDSSGGAGIQADIKAILTCGAYPMTAITAVTAQNTAEVRKVQEINPSMIVSQIEAVVDDLRPNAVKIGMLPGPDSISAVASCLAGPDTPPVVLDPVMVSTSGTRLMREDGIESLKTLLLPLCHIATPNLREAEALAGIPVETKEDMEKAARIIHALGPRYVLIKGGHASGHADDLLFDGNAMTYIKGKRIYAENTHGTGCTLASLLAAFLALGMPCEKAVTAAKKRTCGAMRHGLDMGKGPGPVHVLHALSPDRGAL